MFRTTMALAVILGGAVLVGCDSQDETKPVVPPPSTPTTPPVTPPPTPTAATPTADTVNTATASATAAAGDTSAQAQAKLNEVLQYVKENKVDLADKALKELEGMKASLPAAMQTQLPALRTQVDAMKAGGG